MLSGRLKRHNKSWGFHLLLGQIQTVSMQPTGEISMTACHFPERPLLVLFSPLKDKTYAKQVTLLQVVLTVALRAISGKPLGI